MMIARSGGLAAILSGSTDTGHLAFGLFTGFLTHSSVLTCCALETP